MLIFRICIVVGLICGGECIIDWIAVGAAAAVASAVTSGTSFIASLAGAPGYSVVCTIEIENWTKYPLVYPESYINGGILKSPPVAVKPGVKEAFIAHKTGNTATGTYGTASWLLASKKRRAVIMWSCPYSFDFHSNWLAVGLTDPGYEHHRNWYRQMYYGSRGSGLNFARGEYYYHTKTISVKDGFEVVGIMGTSHKAKAKIIVRPLYESDLAPKLKEVYEKSKK